MPSRWRRKKSEKKKKPDSPTNVPDGTDKIKAEAIHAHGDAGPKVVAPPSSSESTKRTNVDKSNPKMGNSTSRETDNGKSAKPENYSNAKMENDPHLPSRNSTVNGLVVQKNGGKNGKGNAKVSDVQKFEQESNRSLECDDQLVDRKDDGELEVKSKIVEPLTDKQQRASNGSPSGNGSGVSDFGKKTKDQSTSFTKIVEPLTDNQERASNGSSRGNGSGVSDLKKETKEQSTSLAKIVEPLIDNQQRALNGSSRGNGSGVSDFRKETKEQSTTFAKIVEPLTDNQQRASNGSSNGNGSGVSDFGKETKEQSTSLTKIIEPLTDNQQRASNGSSSGNASGVSDFRKETKEQSTSLAKIVEPLTDNQQRASNGSSNGNGSGVSDFRKETKEQSTSLTKIVELLTDNQQRASNGSSNGNASGVSDFRKETKEQTTSLTKIVESLTDNQQRTSNGSPSGNGSGVSNFRKETKDQSTSSTASCVTEGDNAVSSEVPKDELPIKIHEAVIETGKGENIADGTRMHELKKEESRENVDNDGALDLVEPTKEEHKEILPFPASMEADHEDKVHVVINTTSTTSQITENMDDYAHANSVKTPSEGTPEIVLFPSTVEIDQQANRPAITLDAAEKLVALSSKDTEELKMTETERKLLPLIERPTSWKCCCGILDVLMSSDR